MEFKQDAKVFALDGREVGHVDRVVLDPTTKAVTHIVVRKGFLFTEDRVVPLDLIVAATAEHVTLREDAGDLHALPKFEEPHYVIPEDERIAASDNPASPVYPYPPLASGSLIGYPTSLNYGEPPYATYLEQNIPDGAVALKEGAKVFTDDNQPVGNIEQVFTDFWIGDQVTHFLVSKGLLLKEKKLVPISWVSSIGEAEIRLAVSARLLGMLRPYER